MTAGTVPLWLWLLVVGAALLVAVVVGREPRPTCIGCGRLMPPSEWRITPHDLPAAPPLCLDCYGRTFR